MRNVVLCVFGALQIMFVALATQNAIAQHAIPTTFSASSLYIENKGQIGDQHGKPNHDVRFLILRPGLNIQLRQNGFSYDSYTVDRCELPEDTALRYLPAKFQERPNEEITYRFHRVDVDLVGANPKPLITATGASSDYLNYYTHITQQVHGDKGATDVRGYARVTYHDVWPGVDMEWFIDDQQRPEYQFVIRPGGNVAAIQLRYRGAHGTRLDEEHLVLDVQHGPIRESLPRSYVQSTGSTVDVRYRAIGGNVYGFTTPPIDIAMGETLVIDPMPELLWATYYGGVGSDVILSVTATPEDDIIAAGWTMSSTGIATDGAFKTELDSVGYYYRDAMIVSFKSNGERTFGTYFGGSGLDMAASVVVANNADIIIAGSTTSTDKISTDASHQERNAGKEDGIVARFSSTGARLWSTFYGGSDRDIATSLAVDSFGRVAVCGTTHSLNGISTVGSFQAEQGTARFEDSSSVDAFLVRFSSDGVRLWGTYIGDARDEEARHVAIARNGEIVVVGLTSSESGVATVGSGQTSYGGGYADAFVMKFTAEGSKMWGSYLGGEDYDCANAVAVSLGDSIVVGGYTSSIASIASTDGHQSTLDGGADGFLVCLNADGLRLWSSYYGGSNYDEVIAIKTDTDGNVLMSGETRSQNNISTEGGHRSVYMGGGSDAFLAKFAPNGRRLWGTYYGGGGHDRVTSVAVLSTSDVIIAGSTVSRDGIATANSFKDTVQGNLSGDSYIARFRSVADCAPPLVAIIANGARDVCVATETKFTANVARASRLRWSIPQNGTIVKGSLGDSEIVVRWNVAGDETIHLQAQDLVTGCVGHSGVSVSVKGIPRIGMSRYEKPCTGSEVSYHATESNRDVFIYLWQVSSGGEIVRRSYDSTSVVIHWIKPGIDTVRLRVVNRRTGCFNETVSIRLDSLPERISITGPTSVCYVDRALYRTDEISRTWYTWSNSGQSFFGPDTNASSKELIWSSVGVHKVSVIMERDGCRREASLDVEVFALPTVRIAEETRGILVANTNAQQATYQWYYADRHPPLIPIEGETASTFTPKDIGTYRVEVANTFTGCKSLSPPFRFRVINTSVVSPPECKLLSITALHPNPAFGYTRFTTSTTTDVVLKVIDVLGRVHLSQSIAAGETTTTISTSGLPSGSYYLRLEPVEGRSGVQAHTQALIVVP